MMKRKLPKAFEQYKNVNITNIVLAVAFKINKTNVVCNLKCNPLVPNNIYFYSY